MVERLHAYREPAAWVLLGACVAWTVWRMVAAFMADGPIGVLGAFSSSLFSIISAVVVLIAAALMVLTEPMPKRTGLFLTVAAVYGAAALVVALVFQLIGIFAPLEPESWFIRVIGFIGFLALHLIPFAAVVSLWWARSRVLSDRVDDVRSILSGDLDLRREHLVEGADEPTRRISVEQFREYDEATRRIPRENLGHDLTSK